MEAASNKMAVQAEQLAPAAASLAKHAAEYAGAHGSSGLPLYDAKVHALLQYSANLCRYAAARARGDVNGDIPALQEKLVAGWAMLDRIRPLEKAQRPAMEVLLKRAARARAAVAVGGEDGGGGGGGGQERIAPRPDPGNMVLDDDDEGKKGEGWGDGGPGGAGGDEEGKVYRPPRIAEVVYDGERQAVEEREARAREKMQARAARSRSVREMLAEVSGRPDEVRDEDGEEEGAVGREMARLRREEEDRTRYEEENFTRLNVTRDDRRRRQKLASAAELSGGLGDVGGDAFADLMGVAERVIGKGGRGDAAKRAGQERVSALDAFDGGIGWGGTTGDRGSGQKKRGGNGGGSKKRKSRKRN